MGPVVRFSWSVARNSPNENSSVSPGRNGNSSPHSMKMMTRLIHTNSVWKWSSSQLGSIQGMPRSMGCRPVTRRAYRAGLSDNLYGRASPSTVCRGGALG